MSSEAGEGSASSTDEADLEKKDADALSVQSQDVKHRQEFRGWTLLALAFQSIGTVYGDIGTSPLYVYSSTFTEPPAADELLCAVSLIIWSLTIMVTVKYILIVLYADDNGEGGTFALYGLLARYARLEDKEPGKAVKDLNRYKTGELSRPAGSMRHFFENSTFFKRSIRLAAIFGICSVLADGVFTPAQSVLGAIQGAKVANSNLSTGAIIGISIGLLVLLFAVQPLGINRLAFCYAPIVTIWLLFNLASAFYNFAVFDASVFKAFNPFYAGKWFTVRGADVGFHRLGGILLCFTGVEALFADMGAFSRRAIQCSWLFFAYPCLILTYLGQAANITVNPDNYSNPFFLTLPPGCFWPGLIISILAAVVASQAMITASFQILSQAMQLCYFPRIRVRFTSTMVHNQVYIPLANTLLMAGCVIVTGVFNNTTALGNAYGLCVIMVTMITTFLTTLVACIVWRFHLLLVVLPIFLIFATFDGLWLSISLLKVPNGAWVTLMIACGLAIVMVLWRTGKSMQWSAEAEQIALCRHDIDLARNWTEIDGIGVFFDEANDRIPPIFSYWLRSFEARHKLTVFAHLRQTYYPTVRDEDRFTIMSIPEIPHTFRVLVRYGYNEHNLAIEGVSKIIDSVRAHIDVEKSTSVPGTQRNVKATQDLEALEHAITSKMPLYLFGRKEIQVKPGTKNPIRRFTIWVYGIIRDTMTSKPRLWELPADSIVEIGKAVAL